MNRLATYAWSLSTGLLGYFIGFGLLARYHTYDNWQIGLAGFAGALALAVPTAISVSQLCAAAPKWAVRLFACTGLAILVVMLWVWSLMTFH